MSFGAEFLVEPDLFPGRPSGEEWGEAALCLDVAGGPYRLEGLSAAQAEALADRFGPLAARGEEGPAGVRLRFFRAPEADFRDIAMVGWQTTFDLDPQPTALRIAGRRFVGRLEWSPALSAALWTAADEDSDFPGIAENFLRVVVAQRAIERGGALLHSAGIAAPGGAYLFFGPSGAGKSTISRLSAEAGHTVLSDELNIVIEEGGELVVEQLPFAGDFGRVARGRESHRLAGAFRLAKTAAPCLKTLPRPIAVAALAGCAPFVNGDPHRSARLLENLDRLTGRCRIGELGFALDPGFWGILLPPS